MSNRAAAMYMSLASIFLRFTRPVTMQYVGAATSFSTISRVISPLLAKLKCIVSGRNSVGSITSPIIAVIVAGPRHFRVPPFPKFVLTVSRVRGSARLVIPERVPLSTVGMETRSTSYVKFVVTFRRTGPARTFPISPPSPLVTPLARVRVAGVLSTKTIIVTTPHSGISLRTTRSDTSVLLQTSRRKVELRTVVDEWQYIRMNLFIRLASPKNSPVSV